MWVSIFLLVAFIENTVQTSTACLSLSLSIGISSGAILVFDVPSKGSNITLSEVLEEHKESITDMAAECSGSQVCCECFFNVYIVCGLSM